MTRNGVASIAWYVRIHLIAPMTGYVDSCTATCIALAANSPGARNTRYVTPLKLDEDDPPLTRPPRPSPIAARNSTGAKIPFTRPARQVRRYAYIQYSSERSVGWRIVSRPMCGRPTARTRLRVCCGVPRWRSAGDHDCVRRQ